MVYQERSCPIGVISLESLSALSHRLIEQPSSRILLSHLIPSPRPLMAKTKVGGGNVELTREGSTT